MDDGSPVKKGENGAVAIINGCTYDYGLTKADNIESI